MNREIILDSRLQGMLKELAGWLQEGKLKYGENIIDGSERIPEVFLGLV